MEIGVPVGSVVTPSTMQMRMRISLVPDTCLVKCLVTRGEEGDLTGRPPLRLALARAQRPMADTSLCMADALFLVNRRLPNLVGTSSRRRLRQEGQGRLEGSLRRREWSRCGCHEQDNGFSGCGRTCHLMGF